MAQHGRAISLDTAERGVHRYEILSALGQGSFGVVYLARYWGPEGFTRLVALKVLRDDVALPEDVARRTRDEARILGMIRHRAIVQVDRLVSLGDRIAVAMEYVEGISLSQLLSAGPLAPRHALEIAAEVAGALHVAHGTKGPDGRPLGLMHRDIKPSNILISVHGEVKVLDFGVARADFRAREALTRDLYVGTPGYMAPERLLRVERAAGDVYSLGVVLWELLARTRFGRSSCVAEQHEERTSRAIASLVSGPGLPMELAELLSAMMSFNPDNRPRAREVEQRGLALASSMDDVPLRFWAETAVRPVLDMAAFRDPLRWRGKVFAEGSSRPEQPSPRPAPPLQVVLPEDALTMLASTAPDPSYRVLGVSLGLLLVLGLGLVCVAVVEAGRCDGAA